MRRRKEGEDERRKGLPSPHGDLCLLPAIKPPSCNHEYNYHVVSATEIEIIRRVTSRVPTTCGSHDPKILAQNILGHKKQIYEQSKDLKELSYKT